MVGSNLQVSQHRVLFDPGEENPHGVGSVVQEGDARSVQVAGQLVNVRLQLREGWGEETEAIMSDEPQSITKSREILT